MMLIGLILCFTILTASATALPRAKGSFKNAVRSEGEMACLTSLSNVRKSAEVMKRYLAAAYLNFTGDKEMDYLHTAGLSCDLCQQAISSVISLINHEGCGFIFGVEIIAACEVLGFGPEDPVTWACTALFMSGCSTVLSYIEQGITDPNTICQALDAC